MPPSLLRVISGETGLPGQLIETAVAGYYNQIRKLEPLRAKILTVKELSEVAGEYGARHDIAEKVLQEAARLVVQKFPFLGLHEIREAYRMWATGDIQVKGAEMYGGEFNAAQVGKILSAYNEQRKKALAEYLRHRMEEMERRERELRAEKARQEYEENFERLLSECTAEDWRDVPHHWFGTAWRRGMIELSLEEIEDIKRDALQLAEIELQNEKEETGSPFARNNLEKYIKDGGVEERARTIAMKITVFRKLINKGKNDNNE